MDQDIDRLRSEALALVDQAIEIYDHIGESTPACHLQLGSDLLRCVVERDSALKEREARQAAGQ